MKKIEITTSKKIIELKDNDDSDISVYREKLYEIFSSNEIVMIKTSENFLMIKPSEIISIELTEDISKNKKSKEKKKIEVIDDVVMDEENIEGEN